MIEKLDDVPDGVLGWELVGHITDADYRDVLAPMVKDAHERGEKIRAICVIGDRFEGYTAGATWDDAKLGFAHPTAWERIALVSDLDWLRHLASGFGWLVPGELKVFPLADLDDAKEWITR